VISVPDPNQAAADFDLQRHCKLRGSAHLRADFDRRLIDEILSHLQHQLIVHLHQQLAGTSGRWHQVSIVIIARLMMSAAVPASAR